MDFWVCGQGIFSCAAFFWKQPLIMKHFAVLEFFDFLKGTLSVNPWITVLFGLPI